MGVIYNAARQVLHTGVPTNGTNAVQTVTIGGTPTSGTFVIHHEGFSSAPITWSSTNATLLANIDAALELMPSIGTGGVTTADSSLSSGIGALTLTFTGNRAKQPVTLATVTSSLVGTAPTIAITSTTAGVSATHRGAPKGQRLLNTNSGIEYRNIGTAQVPDWRIPGIQSYTVSPAVGATTAVHAAVTDTAVQVVVTTGITNPAVPRNITATSGGTAGDIKAIQVIIVGTDMDDAALTETLPVFTENSATTVVGSKAFKTVTSITIPAHDGTGATTAIGTGAKLGLPVKMNRNGVVNVHFGGVRETTAATVAHSSTVLASNTAQLNSTLDASEVIIDYHNA